MWEGSQWLARGGRMDDKVGGDQRQGEETCSPKNRMA